MASNPPGNGQIITLKDKINDVRGLLDKMRDQLAMALPKHFTVDRFLRIALTAVQKEPKLLDCHRATFLGSLVECAQLGLEPNTTLGHAYLIPFWNGRTNRLEAQFMPGYKGLVKLAYQSGMLDSFRAHVVREKDVFDYEYGLDEKLIHKPHRGSDAGQMVAVYAAAQVKGVARGLFWVLEKWECEKIRDNFSIGYQKARNKEATPWHRNFDEMSMKSAARKLCKWLPSDAEKSAHLMRAVDHDERAEAGIGQEFGNVIDLSPEDVRESDGAAPAEEPSSDDGGGQTGGGEPPASPPASEAPPAQGGAPPSPPVPAASGGSRLDRLTATRTASRQTAVPGSPAADGSVIR
jgi:recombination protein RecT